MPAPKKNPHHDPYDPGDDQDQKQAQKQAELQAQLQGQGQGQAQGQGQLQFAVQSVDTDVENKVENKSENENENKNENENENSNENKVENKVENEVDSKVDNDVENKVENTVENAVENKVEVKVDVDLGLDLDSLTAPDDSDVIDIEYIKDIEGSIVMPDVVTQGLTGDGNQFNIDQVNNIVDNDFLWSPEVKYDGHGLEIEAKAEGGISVVGYATADLGDDGNISGVGTSTADALVSQEAFTQNIIMGANIQFNSIEMSVAGHDLTTTNTGEDSAA